MTKKAPPLRNTGIEAGIRMIVRHMNNPAITVSQPRILKNVAIPHRLQRRGRALLRYSRPVHWVTSFLMMRLFLAFVAICLSILE